MINKQTPQAAPVAASHPDLGALTRYEHYCSYDGGGGADEEVEADGSWVRYDDVVKLLSATQPSPQAAPVAAEQPIAPDKYCVACRKLLGADATAQQVAAAKDKP